MSVMPNNGFPWPSARGAGGGSGGASLSAYPPGHCPGPVVPLARQSQAAQVPKWWSQPVSTAPPLPCPPLPAGACSAPAAPPQSACHHAASCSDRAWRGSCLAPQCPQPQVAVGQIAASRPIQGAGQLPPGWTAPHPMEFTPMAAPRPSGAMARAPSLGSRAPSCYGRVSLSGMTSVDDGRARQVSQPLLAKPPAAGCASWTPAPVPLQKPAVASELPMTPSASALHPPSELSTAYTSSLGSDANTNSHGGQPQPLQTFTLQMPGAPSPEVRRHSTTSHVSATTPTSAGATKSGSMGNALPGQSTSSWRDLSMAFPPTPTASAAQASSTTPTAAAQKQQAGTSAQLQQPLSTQVVQVPAAVTAQREPRALLHQPFTGPSNHGGDELKSPLLHPAALADIAVERRWEARPASWTPAPTFQPETKTRSMLEGLRSSGGCVSQPSTRPTLWKGQSQPESVGTTPAPVPTVHSLVVQPPMDMDQWLSLQKASAGDGKAAAPSSSPTPATKQVLSNGALGTHQIGTLVAQDSPAHALRPLDSGFALGEEMTPRRMQQHPEETPVPSQQHQPMQPLDTQSVGPSQPRPCLTAGLPPPMPTQASGMLTTVVATGTQDLGALPTTTFTTTAPPVYESVTVLGPQAAGEKYVPPTLPGKVHPIAGVEELDPQVVYEMLQRGAGMLVDVRGDDRSSGIIEGSVHEPAVDTVPFVVKVPELAKRWAAEPLVVFTCQFSQHRAPSCANDYRESAEKSQRVAILYGGFRHWEAVGLPVKDLATESNQAHTNVVADDYALAQGLSFVQLRP